MDWLKSIGAETIGAIVVAVFGWIGWNKVKKVTNQDGGESDALAVLRQEVERLANQVSNLSVANQSLQKQIFDERDTCAQQVAELKREIADLKHTIHADRRGRASEADLRKRGLLKTRASDK